jgi:DNA-binding transcriptional LysR family regulator
MLEMNVGTVDLNLLRVFLAIWETHSLTIAGDRLALTQPAVSHSLRRLRELFDDPVFVRTPEGMQPTAAAIRLHGPIDQALGMISLALQQHAGFDAGTAVRTFRISMSDMSEFYFLPPLLADLQDRAPGIRFDVVQAPLNVLESGMRSGEIDLAIGYVPGLSQDCASQSLFQDQHVCMVRAGHPMIKRTITTEVFGQLRYIFANSNATGHRLIEQWLAALDIKRNIVLHLPHFTVAPEIVRSTDLAVIFPRSIAERFNRSRTYKLLQLPFVFPAIEVRLHWHQRFAGDAGISWLRTTLVDMFSRPDTVAEDS